MAKNKISLAQIVESWGPAVKSMTKNQINESSPRFEWMCEYAHNHVMALNEDNVITGTGFPMQNLFNTNGIGNPVPPSYAGHTGADQMNPNAQGSGDKWPVLLPMALQVAGRTIGFDLVNTIPTPGPTYVLPFTDYVYSGSKDVYGATPSRNPQTANPMYPAGDTDVYAYNKYEAPHAFRSNLGETAIPETPDASKYVVKKTDVVKSLLNLPDNSILTITNDSASVKVQFIGLTRLSAEPMFKVMPESKNVALASVFDGSASATIDMKFVDASHTAATSAKMTINRPRLISALEDHILGFTGAGKYDTDRWSATYQDPKHLYEPMDRGTGEMQYPRQMSLKVFTKTGTVGTQSVAVAATQEQIQDLQKQWGIDVMKLIENAAINELSQSINKHILSRLFALGWRNHCNAYRAEGINLNLDLTNPTASDHLRIFFATYDEEGVVDNETQNADRIERYTMDVNTPKIYGTFENTDTMYKHIGTNMLYAGNIIMQRGRRGPGTFAVTNAKVATMLQSNSQYAFAPIANTFNQNNGSLYPLGTIAGLTLYVDPMMSLYDTRILVGRKAGKEEPGVAFCPYVMAESIRLITEQTGSPKVLIKSRYSLVDMGWYPELNYITFFVRCPDVI